MKRKDGKKQAQSKCSLLDTSSDFQEDPFVFRYPKKSKTENADDRSRRGRPKKGAKVQSETRKKCQEKQERHLSRLSQSSNGPLVETAKGTPELCEDFPSSVDGQSASPSILYCVNEDAEDPPLLSGSEASSSEVVTNKEADGEDVADDLSELEKSVCSSSERLCPSCKHIVCLAEYPDHFSKCLQKFSFSKIAKKKTTDDSSILPCPICLKPLSTGIERRSHIKSCGSSHGLSTEQLILATRLQEKQAEERQALGLPALRLGHESNEAKKRKGTTSRRAKAAPDSDMQLAFALSRSLAEEERERRVRKEERLVALGLEDVIQEERRTLTLPQVPPLLSNGHARSRGTRGKKKKDSTRTVLMTRTKEERERIITEKVAEILVDEGTAGCPPLHKKPLPPRLPGPLDQYLNQKSPLWYFGATGTEVPIESHFVSELGEFIKPQNVPVGELLKNLSQVPGRLNYTALAEDFAADEENPEEEEGAVESTIVDLYCTQLALAEMLGTQEMAEFSHIAEEREDTQAQTEDSNEHREKGTKNENEITVIEGHESVVEILTDEERILSPKEKEYIEQEVSSIEVKAAGFTYDNTAIDSLLPSNNHNSGLETAVQSNVEAFPQTFVSSPANTAISSRSPSSPLSTRPLDLSGPNSTLHDRMIYDWSRLLASGDRSDVCIVTTEAEIPIHSFVLYVRCPDLFQELQQTYPCLSTVGQTDAGSDSLSGSTSKQIDWSSLSYEAVYSFMAYLYSGVCTVTSKESDVWMGLFDLALKYHCQELVTHLENIYKTSSSKKNDFEEKSSTHGNGYTDQSGTLKKVISFSQSGDSPDCMLDRTKAKESSNINLEVSKNLDAAVFSRQLKKRFDLSLDAKTPCRIVPPELTTKAPPSSLLESPDIFGDCSDTENSKTLVDTPSVKSSANNITGYTPSFSTSNSAKDLHYAEKKLISAGEANEDGENDSILIVSEPEEKEDFSKSLDTSIKKKLSSDFNDSFPSPVRDEMERSPLLLLADGDQVEGDSEQMDIPHSPFSDYNYPSGNEVVDLTLTSDEFADSPKAISAPLRERIIGSPAKALETIVTSPTKLTRDKSRGKAEDEWLSDIPFLRKDNCMALPSNLSALTKAPISNGRIPDKLKNGKLLLSPVETSEKRAAVSSSPVKVPNCSSEKNRLRRSLNSQSKLAIGDGNTITGDEKLSNSFQGMSDESFLKAVCATEEQLVLSNCVSTSARTKLPKSKSLMDSPSMSSRSFGTPGRPGTFDDSPMPTAKQSFAITPLPDYQSMVSPQLQKELDKFGIRKLSRKKAIKLLLHIYEQMHPLVSDSEADASFTGRSPHLSLTPALSKGLSKSKARRKIEPRKAPKPKKHAENAIDEDVPTDVLNSSQSTNTSTDSNFDCLEETAFLDPQEEEEEEDDDITQSQQTSLETRLQRFIRANEDLYHKVLTYEPIWANELHQNVKASGIKCNIGKLIQFLDDQCITFRLPSKERRKRRRKNSPTKSPRKKQAKRS